MRIFIFLLIFFNVYSSSYAANDIIEAALYSSLSKLEKILNSQTNFSIVIFDKRIDARDLALFYLLACGNSDNPEDYRKIKILYKTGAHWHHLNGLRMPSMKLECKKRLSINSIKKSILNEFKLHTNCYLDTVERTPNKIKKHNCKEGERLYDINDLAGTLGAILYDKNFCNYVTACGESLFDMINYDKTAVDLYKLKCQNF